MSTVVPTSAKSYIQKYTTPCTACLWLTVKWSIIQLDFDINVHLMNEWTLFIDSHWMIFQRQLTMWREITRYTEISFLYSTDVYKYRLLLSTIKGLKRKLISPHKIQNCPSFCSNCCLKKKVSPKKFSNLKHNLLLDHREYYAIHIWSWKPVHARTV